MDKFDRYVVDNDILKPEYRETYNIFDLWYQNATKRPFIVWWVTLGLFTAYYCFEVAHATYVVYGWNVVSTLAFLLLFTVPTVGCAGLARLMVNWLHYDSLRSKCITAFDNDPDAIARLEQYRKRIF